MIKIYKEVETSDSFWLHVSKVVPGMELSTLSPGPHYNKLESIELDAYSNVYKVKYEGDSKVYTTGSHTTFFVKETEEFPKNKTYERINI